MAYSTSIIKEMIIKTTVFLILIHLMIIKVTHGHLGCEGDLVPCLNQTHCININQVCVDYHDCVDEDGHKICNYCHSGKNDLIACVTHYEPHLTFECLSPNEICDGTKNCVNNEDEHLCDIEKCKQDFWLCKSGKCIEKHLICDGQKNCPDGSDEDDFCHSIICGPQRIHCPTGECILRSKMCDGVSHCPDGYDEQNCSHSTSINSCSIPSNTFNCSTSQLPICISNNRVCDGYKDCPMGDDEYGCTAKCTPKSRCISNPNVNCIQHPSADQLCRCVKQGYRLTTNQLCQDFDECNDSFGTYCSYNCINTDGSFNCTCPLGFSLDKTAKICRKLNDQTKPNLLILFDDNISLYNIDNNSLKLFNKINIGKTHYLDSIKYDSNQMFVIYYDQNLQTIFCKSSTTRKPLILLSNIIIQTFAYNVNEKILFLIENQSKTLRMYTSITCEVGNEMKMHSWELNKISNPIQSMEIDVYNRQFIFATEYEFLISNMSEPNVTKVVYSTDRQIKRFLYDASFKRIFCTTVNSGITSVYTCDNGFQKCQDTYISLSSEWPFAFYNDGLLYPSISKKSLDIVQIYGKDLVDYQQTDFSNICMKNSSTIRCKDKICLQINSTEINCLSIDENLLSKVSIIDVIDLDSQDNIQSLVDDGTRSQIGYQRKTSNTILFCIITLGVLVAILAFFVKRYYKRLHKQVLNHEQHLNAQYLVTDEPNLDEFNVMVDERNNDRLPLTNQLNY